MHRNRLGVPSGVPFAVSTASLIHHIVEDALSGHGERDVRFALPPTRGSAS
ncbi:hypothetical protein GCM10009610_07750 [Pseudonocardia xinjiangensis]